MGPTELVHVVCAIAVLRSCKHIQLLHLIDHETGSSQSAAQQISLQVLRTCQRGTNFPSPLHLSSNISFSKSLYPELKKWQFTDTLFVADLRPAESIAVLKKTGKVWEWMSRLPWLLISDAASHQLALRDLTWRPDNRGESGYKFSEAYRADATTPLLETELGAVDFPSIKILDGAELAKDPWDRRRNLSGIILRCSVISYSSAAIVTPAPDGTVHVTGLSADIFEALQSSLNLRFKCRLPSEVTPGSSSSRDYSGVLGDLYQDRADIAMPFFFRYADRESDFDFTYTISNQWYSLALHRPKKFQGASNYTREFDWTGWVATFSLFVLCVCVLKMVVKFCIGHENISLSSCLFNNFKLFCNMGQDRDMAYSLSYRLWLLTVLVSVMVLHVSYSSSLITLLTTYKLVLPFQDLHGLYRVRDEFTLGIERGTTVEQFMQTDTESVLGDIYRNMILKRPELVRDLNFSYQRMLQDRSHTMFYPILLPIEDCRILRLKQRYFVFPVAFPAHRGLAVLPILNSQLKKMHSGGLFQRLMRKWGLDGRSRPCPGVPATALGLEETYTAFSLLAFGAAASILFLLAEFAMARIHNPGNQGTTARIASRT
ncbi:Ionotropic glutamate receptor L-glutamate and glycine-binding domain [Trinorchestia longiramus]|nr:Ionotropic glutamate receptor L-glutamate and glycine-binding domain [Trinorchestia longiramus]